MRVWILPADSRRPLDSCAVLFCGCPPLRTVREVVVIVARCSCVPFDGAFDVRTHSRVVPFELSPPDHQRGEHRVCAPCVMVARGVLCACSETCDRASIKPTKASPVSNDNRLRFDIITEPFSYKVLFESGYVGHSVSRQASHVTSHVFQDSAGLSSLSV